jgi:hypothetical protein
MRLFRFRSRRIFLTVLLPLVIVQLCLPNIIAKFVTDGPKKQFTRHTSQHKSVNTVVKCFHHSNHVGGF